MAAGMGRQGGGGAEGAVGMVGADGVAGGDQGDEEMEVESVGHDRDDDQPPTPRYSSILPGPPSPFVDEPRSSIADDGAAHVSSRLGGALELAGTDYRKHPS